MFISSAFVNVDSTKFSSVQLELLENQLRIFQQIIESHVSKHISSVNLVRLDHREVCASIHPKFTGENNFQ